MPNYNNGKPWYLSKTIWFNIISLLASILAYYGIDIPADQIGPIATLIVIIGNIILRGVTKEAVTL